MSALAPYPSPEQRELELDALAAAVGLRGFDIELSEYGRSVEGRALRCVRVRRQPHALRVLVCANTHGPEFIGNRVCVGLLHALAHDRAPASLHALLDRAELWLAPCLNPDGYARTFARDGQGSLPELRHNHRGVDLNRNWPLPEGTRRLPIPAAGSPTPGHATYRGPHPLSEPETAALDQLLAREHFHASANLHSFMGTLFPARVLDRNTSRSYAQLCRALSDAQPHTHYLRLASRVFDTFTGEQEDHQHHSHHCWSVCVESFSVLASLAQNRGQQVPLFWRFNPREPERWVSNDVPGVAAFLHAAIALDRPPAKPKKA